MRYRTLAATLGLTLMTSLSVPVLAQATKPAAPAAGKPAGNAAEPSRWDKDFLTDALQSGLTTVEASRIMLAKTKDQKVKEFADRVIRDQGALNGEITAIMKQKAVEVPSEPGVLQRTQLKALESLDTAEAEKMYAKQFGVALQENDLYRYQDASTKADDASLRTFAKSKVSSFQDRMNLARSLGRSDKGH
jgi:putative membrane protein